ncbi:MAG: glycosyltransferase family 4 protein [Gemmatimonadales bacterium]
MRIAYVLKRYPRYSETFIVAELLAHQAAGLEVEIFVLKAPNESIVQPAVARVRYPVTYLTGESGETAQARRLADLVTARGIGLLHAHFATSATAVAAEAARLAGVPFTFTAHAKDIFHHDVDPDTLTARIAAAARVVTVSDYNRSHLSALAGLRGVPADRIVRIYNGIDLAEYPVRFGGRDLRVLAVGRLVEKKGFADLLAALHCLLRRGTPVAADLVGTGPLAESLALQARRLGLADLVQFHGALPRDEVARPLRHSGVFVAPCVVSADGDRDGLPTVMLEAMASGIPVVATPVTGIPEAIQHGKSGWLVPQRSPEDLGAILAGVLADPDRGAQAARAARLRIEQDFDLGRSAAALRRVFADAVALPLEEAV